MHIALPRMPCEGGDIYPGSEPGKMETIVPTLREERQDD